MARQNYLLAEQRASMANVVEHLADLQGANDRGEIIENLQALPDILLASQPGLWCAACTCQ